MLKPKIQSLCFKEYLGVILLHFILDLTMLLLGWGYDTGFSMMNQWLVHMTETLGQQVGRPSEGGKRWTSSVGCLTATSVAEGDPGGRALSAPELNDSCSGPGTPSQAPAHQTKDGAGHAALSALTSAPQKPPPGGSSGEDARHATHRESPGKGRR